MILKSLDIKKIKVVRNDEFRTNCQICDDNKLHCYVNTTKGVWYCFKCTNKGIFKADTFFLFDKTYDSFNTQNINLNIRDPIYEHIQYLVNRGCNVNQIFLYSPVTIDKYPLYVFSTYSKVMLIGRCIIDNSKLSKYIKICYNSYLPYGYEYVPYNPSTLCIVEGIFDLLVVQEYYPTIALLNKVMSISYRSWIESIKPQHIYIILDGDAKKYIDIMYNVCKFMANTDCIYLPEGNDPWSLKDSLQNYIK